MFTGEGVEDWAGCSRRNHMKGKGLEMYRVLRPSNDVSRNVFYSKGHSN